MNNGQGGNGGRTQRAFGALSFEEEKHTFLGKAHMSIAAWSRWEEEADSNDHPGFHACELLEQELRAELAVASQEILTDKETMLTLLSADGNLLQDYPLELRNDPEAVLVACKRDGYAMEHATPEIQANRDTVLEAVKLDGFALAGTTAELQDDRELVLAAIGSQPLALQFASPALRQDRAMLLVALGCQTRKFVQDFDSNVLRNALPQFQSDREIVLAACKVDGAALTHASGDLKNDKEFVLRVAREAPVDDQQLCYDQADDFLHQSLSLDEFLGAVNSGLALAGDSAPVLSVALLPDPEVQADRSNQKDRNIGSCEVTLISGTSFLCPLSTTSVTIPSPHHDHSLEEGDAEQEPPQKRPKLMGLGEEVAGTVASSRAALTVSDLVKLVLAELPKHTQVDPPAETVFVLFTKANGDSEGVPVTPWDWSRPLSEFL